MTSGSTGICKLLSVELSGKALTNYKFFKEFSSNLREPKWPYKLVIVCAAPRVESLLRSSIVPDDDGPIGAGTWYNDVLS